jgi:2-iminobutanoate/2-iminopropanoate deaminase
MRIVAGILLLVVGLSASAAEQTGPPPASSGPPYSKAVPVGDTLYVAGHIATDPKTGQAPADPRVEATMMLDDVKHTVEASGFAMDDLVSVTVYCTDLALFDTFNSVYRSYFHGRFPARAFLGVSTLLRGAHFEVQGIAVRHSH